MTIKEQIDRAIAGMNVSERAIFYAIIAKRLVRDDLECADLIEQAAMLAKPQGAAA